MVFKKILCYLELHNFEHHKGDVEKEGHEKKCKRCGKIVILTFDGMGSAFSSPYNWEVKSRKTG